MTNEAQVTRDDLVQLSPEELVTKYGNGNKSATIRYLTSLGTITTSQIAKMLNIRYQFVRNVQKEPVRKK